MSYQTEMAEIIQDPFAELFDVQVGLDINYYTSYHQDIPYASHNYLARPIKRGKLTDNERLRAKRVSITAPIEGAMQQYIANAPAEKMTVRVTRVFQNPGQAAVIIFFGEVIDVTIADQMATVSCDANPQVFLNQIPKLVHQARCNHMLFDGGCGLDENLWESLAIVDVSGSTLTSPVFGTFADGYFTGGHVSYDTDIRMITNHIVNDITIQVPFDSRVVTGSQVKAYPGCKKNPDTCRTKFSNFDNFLGMPYIPSSNPIIWGW